MSIRIAIVDDHELFREGISGLLEKIPGFIICGSYENGASFIQGIDENKPDVVLMDIDMPVIDGDKATRLALAKYPDIKILVLSMHCNINYYQKMLAAGAKGFILKDSSKDELKKAISEILAGNSYFSATLLQNIIQSFNISSQNSEIKALDLSRREIAMIELICKGLSNKEISEKLFTSTKTIESAKTKLFEKTQVKNSIELVVFAIRNKIIQV
jgi:DNA-binding NarL/FixJ family response regulator